MPDKSTGMYRKGGENMSEYKIITIGRQFGSGGHEIGQMLADRLEIPLYDHRLVSMAAEALNLKEDTVRKVDESGLKMFLTSYSVSPACYVDFVLYLSLLIWKMILR